MRIPIKIKKDSKVYKGGVPTGWDDINLSEFYDLVDWSVNGKQDMVALYSILTGIPRDVLFNCSKISIKTLIDRNTQWMVEIGNLHKLPIPKTIEFRGKTVDVPKDLRSKKSIGVLFAVEQKLKEIESEEIPTGKSKKRDALLVSFFMYEEITGEEFDGEKAGELLPDIYKLPVTEVYPIAVFFSNALRKLTGTDWPGLLGNQDQRKWKRGLNGSDGRGLLRRWMRLPREISQN